MPRKAAQGCKNQCICCICSRENVNSVGQGAWAKGLARRGAQHAALTAGRGE
jgi:hypothetical protein